MNSNFKPEEIVKFERYNKKEKKNVETSFPIVGGRLRLFHEDLAKARVPDGGGIEIEIIDRDREYALVKACVRIDGNSFTGIGMASKSRDSMIFPAIMEMAETRAIARALRFAGYGVEYTGAEEMQGLKKFDDDAQEPPSDVREPLDAPSNNEQAQDVNDDMAEDEGDPIGETLKRQVWNMVRDFFPGVQENYLADAVYAFVEDTLAKYDHGDADLVYGIMLENQDRFRNAFSVYVEKATPKIQAPGVVEEPKPKMPLAQEDQQKLNQLKKEAADNMKVADPEPAVDKDKVAKANIYRSMPDGINVSALNGTLAHLIKENPDYEAGAIYAMVLDDIDGFMVMLTNWCKNNDTPSGLESPKEKPVLKMDIPTPEKKVYGTDLGLAGKSFRKAWVRLDLDNFNKFIIQNAPTFKSDKAEYDAAVEKFDRLKAKSDDTQNMVFPYVFSHDEVKSEPKLSLDKSILKEGTETVTLIEYTKSYPALVIRTAEEQAINLDDFTEAEAEILNENIERFLTDFSANNNEKTAYTEE